MKPTDKYNFSSLTIFLWKSLQVIDVFFSQTANVGEEIKWAKWKKKLQKFHLIPFHFNVSLSPQPQSVQILVWCLWTFHREIKNSCDLSTLVLILISFLFNTRVSTLELVDAPYSSHRSKQTTPIFRILWLRDWVPFITLALLQRASNHPKVLHGPNVSQDLFRRGAWQGYFQLWTSEQSNQSRHVLMYSTAGSSLFMPNL